jgi:endonuclease/exonuclease/phosphatase family metal-dependent hydrolase
MDSLPLLTLRFSSYAALTCALLALSFGCSSDPITHPPNTTGATVGSGGGGGGGARPDPLPLTVATWNVRNFINNLNDDPAPNEEVVTQAEYEKHRSDIGRVLIAIDADIVVLQEIEHEGVLNDLNDAELDGRYLDIRAIDGNDPRGIDVGVMSKHAIDNVVSHKDEWFTANGTGQEYNFSRDCMETHVTFNGRSLVLLGVHFRSKQNDIPNKRLAEAQRTRVIADELSAESPQTGIVVLGDFNDLPGSAPYLAVLGDGADAYRNAADELATADRWTYNFMGTEELVDHQMSNPLLSDMLQSAEILHGPEVNEASDHSPLIGSYLVN